MQAKVGSVSVAATWDFTVIYLAGLVALLADAKPVTPNWDLLERVLQSLPLGTNDFGPLSNRLNSARQYLAEGERGAAKFEFKQLGSRLERLQERQGW